MNTPPKNGIGARYEFKCLYKNKHIQTSNGFLASCYYYVYYLYLFLSVQKTVKDDFMVEVGH